MALSGRGFSDEMMALSNWNTPGISITNSFEVRQRRRWVLAFHLHEVCADAKVKNHSFTSKR
jgi:hypothetical protein